MIPTYRNSSPSFPFELNNEVHDLNHPLVSTNYQVASSSSYSTCQTFFNSTTTNQDQIGYYHSEFYRPQHQPEVDKYASRSGSHDLEKKNKAENGLKITLWKKGNRYHENQNEKNPVKNLDRASMEVTSTNHTHINMKLQDQKQHQSISPLRSTDHGSNSSSNNSNNIPIRVCADCHTTKTPLWRSGPQGPKSLCNACGIRQRKARRAMAAAAAAANGTNFTTAETSTTMKIKVQQQKQKTTKVNTNHVVPFKKRCKFTNAAVGSSSSNTNNAQKKLCFEDFFLNLSNNLAFHRVFPQDEKEAAILLMALSSGLVHG